VSETRADGGFDQKSVTISARYAVFCSVSAQKMGHFADIGF